MATLLGQLNIDKKEFAEIKEEEVREGGTREAGVYDAAVDQAYIRKTDSGANMLEIDFLFADETKFHYSTCVASGDEKGNKTTYTSKQGKEIALPGVTAMRHFLDAIGVEDPAAAQGDVEHFNDKIKALCITGIQGKKLKLGINQYENFYNGETSVRNDVKYWMNTEGENKAGDGILDKVTASLEKNPLKKLKASGASAAPTTGAPVTGGSEAAAKSGW